MRTRRAAGAIIAGVMAALGWVSLPLSAQMRLGTDTSVVFATVEEARAILTNRDEFVEGLSPLDRAARMKKGDDVSESDFLKFVGTNVLAWDEAERRKMTQVFQGIQAQLNSLASPFPKRVLLVKTTGLEEGGADYTRRTTAMLPPMHPAR